MLTYSLEQSRNENLYEMIYEFIKTDIVNGTLKPNEKLPSKRDFANNHGVSVVTVESAYGQLVAEGYIYSKPRSGFFVSEIDIQMRSKNVEVPLYMPEIEKDDKGDINLVNSHTTPENFPFSLWAKNVRNVLSEQDTNLMISPPPGGVMELRIAIAKHLHEFRGIVCRPEQIIIGAGTEYLYGLIVQLLGRNKVYGLEDPGSNKIRNIYKALGVKCKSIYMDGDGVIMSKDNLEDTQIIHISPSHQFPTGIVTSVSRRYSLLQWASEDEGRYIIEDDYDSEFRLRGKPIASLFSMDDIGKVIYFNTFTKTLASTIRISYMVLPQRLIEEYYKKLGFYSCTVSNFEQYTLAGFINNKSFEKHINRMRIQYRSLRDALIFEIKNSGLGKYIDIKEEDSGLHFLMDMETRYSEDELRKLAKKRGVIVSFLTDYCSDYVDNNSGKATAIVNYAGLYDKDIKNVVEKLNNAWENCCIDNKK